MILKDTFVHSHTGSEIIEINYFSDKTIYSDLAKDIIKVWINSPGHRDILLSSGPNANIGVHAGVFSKEDTTKKYLYRDKNTPSTIYKIKATANFYL
jgi:hypothetical protein